MKAKVLNALLIITSLFGYLEWGTNSHSFLFESEWEILVKLFTNPASAAHPFTLIPLFGQVVLLITLFQKKPSRILTYTGICSLGLLLGFMFIIGVLGWNFKILLSTLPFLILALITFRSSKKTPKLMQ